MILRSRPASFGEGAGVPLSAAIGKVKGKGEERKNRFQRYAISVIIYKTD